MDLNKAMVDLYKRSSTTKRKKPIQDGEELNTTVQVGTDLPENLVPKTRFDQLFGCDEVRKQIMDIVNQFKRAIINKTSKSPFPILLCGSKGLGKTSLVEAAANEANLNLISMPLTKLVELTRNEYKETLEHLLRSALKNQPAIVLIDDLEQILSKEECRYSIRSLIRNLLDNENKILVFCATSSNLHKDLWADIDPLLTIHMKRPTTEARFQILSSYKQTDKSLSAISDECLQTLANNSPSFTARDLKKMVVIAETRFIEPTSPVHFESAIETVKQSFQPGTHLIIEKPSVTWKDIGGMSSVRQAFVDILRQTKRGGKNCKFAGIALYGPPGCGKTMVAQAMANEGGYNFISIKPAELVDKFLGETERNIRKVFHDAREYEPCMIYFDEFDGLCGTRGNKDTMTSAIQTLLSEMDGFVNRGHSIILASTNRLEDIDPAMKRPGRLSRHIYVGPPDKQARLDILKVILNRPYLSVDKTVDLDQLATRCAGFTGAELDFLIAEAETKAASNLDLTDDHLDAHILLQSDHLEYALEKIQATNNQIRNTMR